MGSLQNALTNHGCTVNDAAVEFRPLYPINLSSEENDLVTQFYEKLNEDETIEKVYDNLAA